MQSAMNASSPASLHRRGFFPRERGIGIGTRFTVIAAAGRTRPRSAVHAAVVQLTCVDDFLTKFQYLRFHLRIEKTRP